MLCKQREGEIHCRKSDKQDTKGPEYEEGRGSKKAILTREAHTFQEKYGARDPRTTRRTRVGRVALRKVGRH